MLRSHQKEQSVAVGDRSIPTQGWTDARSCGRVFVLAIAVLLSGCAGLPADLSPSSTSVSPTQTPAPQVSPRVEPTASAPQVIAATSADPVPATSAELWALLQQAQTRSYALLLRHAIAPGTGDPANFQLNDCSTQRNLSEEGRQQARQLGQAMRDRAIPVARVLSSQWCRSLETAELLDVGGVEPFPVINSFFQDRSNATPQTNQLRQFLIENQATPGVIVLVTHQVNITELSQIVPQSGEAVVMRVVDGDRLQVLGRLPPP
ncbi:histidine phosphatase family protein [Leptolyngbya sp. AN02str]|uniref:histidine phosphatase family protein n=1 Tax=Leptolyngbya sp. AN02str TaxID=3423363 RepID=UPI003D311D2B